MLDPHTPSLLPDLVRTLEAAFAHLPPTDAAVPALGRMPGVLRDVAAALADNYPYFHPLYAGQMLKPPHPVARAAYALATYVNPNNHARDGGRASSRMEVEAVAELAAMFGLPAHLGHLTSGGTVANLEALWVAGRTHPGKSIVASTQAHYTHRRLSDVLGLPFEAAPVDRRGRLDAAAVEALLRTGRVGTVVATMGTTATGAVDPLRDLLALRDRYAFRVHCDAAYGGYFTLAPNLDPDTAADLAAIRHADSVVVDPHKHGLQPYGCGCVLFADPAVGRFYKHDSPYTYFSSTELHLGEISLECSRPGAAAVALWATQRLLPLTMGGEFAAGLGACHAAAMKLHSLIANDPRIVPAMTPALDIVVWAPREPSIAAASRRSRELFEAAARQNLHLALATLPAEFFDWPADVARDADSVTALRSVLMKPEHLDWVDRIWAILTTL